MKIFPYCFIVLGLQTASATTFLYKPGGNDIWETEAAAIPGTVY